MDSMCVIILDKSSTGRTVSEYIIDDVNDWINAYRHRYSHYLKGTKIKVVFPIYKGW